MSALVGVGHHHQSIGPADADHLVALLPDRLRIVDAFAHRELDPRLTGARLRDHVRAVAGAMQFHPRLGRHLLGPVENP